MFSVGRSRSASLPATMGLRPSPAVRSRGRATSALPRSLAADAKRGHMLGCSSTKTVSPFQQARSVRRAPRITASSAPSTSILMKSGRIDSRAQKSSIVMVSTTRRRGSPGAASRLMPCRPEVANCARPVVSAAAAAIRHDDAGQIVEHDMPLERGANLRDGLERVHAAGRAHPLTEQKRVVSKVRADVERDGAWTKTASEGTILVEIPGRVPIPRGDTNDFAFRQPALHAAAAGSGVERAVEQPAGSGS